MPLIQGGPPEWIWERTPEVLKWEVVTSERPDRQTLYEVRVQCGLEILRLQFVTQDEIKELRAVIDERVNQQPSEPMQPSREPGVSPEREPGNTPAIPAAERPPERREGVVSDPDLGAQH